MENTKLMTNEFEVVLKDIRSSYRLLFQYQKRIMDLTTFIGNYWGFQFESGEPIFCGPPKLWKNIDPGKHWAWDFLLLYNYTFVFSPKDLETWEKVRLMINIVSDTGFYDAPDPVKTRVQDFAPVEASKTQLHIILKTHGKDWRSYMSSQYPSSSDEDEFIQTEEKDNLILGKKYDLSRFVDEEKTTEVLNDFEKFCQANSVRISSDQPQGEQDENEPEAPLS